MKSLLVRIPALLLLGACVYAEGPGGRYAALDLPVHSQTTVHKTVTVNAPPGTTVNISESSPPTVIYRDRPPRRHPDARRCYYESRSGLGHPKTNRLERVCF